jgi:hypothetical protein
MKEMVREKENRDLTDQEAYEASYNFLNLFNMLFYLDNKQKRAMQFEHPEDEDFFASLLANGNKEELRAKLMPRFDFREPSAKRADFDKIK